MSSLNLASFTPLNSQTKKKVITIWKTIFDSNDSFQFRNPVDWQGMGLMDYPKYVQKPMDLNTISRKLRDQKYRTVENVLDDIQLIFDNCKVYNAPGSVINFPKAVDLQLSRQTLKIFHKDDSKFHAKNSLKQHKIKYFLIDLEINPSFTKIKEPQPVQQPMEEQAPFFIEEVSYHDKIKFTDKLTHINSQNLQAIVKRIFEKNPNAVKIIPPEQEPVVPTPEIQPQIKNQTNSPQNGQNPQQQNNQPEINQNIIQQNNPQITAQIKTEDKKVQLPIQQMQPEESKQRGRRSRTVKNTRNDKKQTNQKSSQPKISLDKLQIGTKAQIFIDDLNYQSFEDLMKMLQGMVEQKDKVMKKIKLD